ncbi:MAG: hypothetical protein IT184_09705 [Acidobacteria bacterium]|nr:hypothetical protein [Acidobacteriota bacterium]
MASKEWEDAALSPYGPTSRPALPAWRPDVRAWASGFGSATPADELFHELDGAEVTVMGAGSWRLQVFSVLDDGQWRWIQLGLSGLDDVLATLQVPIGASAAYVNLALNVWFQDQRVRELA